MLRFPPKIIFLEINRVNNIITWKRWRFADPRLLDRSPQPLCWHRTRLPSESGRSWEKLFLCNAVASVSPTPPGKRSRRGVTLHRQNLTPLPNIDGEQTLNLKELDDWGLNLLKDGPPPPVTGMKAGDEEERGPETGGSEPGSRRAFRPCCPAATRARDGSVFFPCFFPCGAQPRIDCQIKSVELFVGPGLRCVVRPDLEVPVEIHFF
jgi:hypothetical protein